MKTATRIILILATMVLASSLAAARIDARRTSKPLPDIKHRQATLNPNLTQEVQPLLLKRMMEVTNEPAPEIPYVAPNGLNSSMVLGWSQQTSGVSVLLHTAKAVSRDVAWIGAAGPTVLRTTTGGATWSTTSVAGITGDIYAIEALDANTAWVTTSPNATFIYRTTDGGASWTQVYTDASSGAFIDAIHMFDATNGIAMGDPVGGQWVILRTSDGGASWVRDVTNAPLQVGTEAGSNNGLTAFGSSNVWFAANSAPAKIYRTTNGGATWSSSTLPGTSTFTAGMSFVSALIGVVGGNNGDVSRTTDGGATWTALSFGGSNAVYGVASAGPRDFWANKASAIYHSGDKGVTWDSVFNNGTGQLINHMSFVAFADSASGWTAGSSGTIAAFYGAQTPPPPPNDIRPSAILNPLPRTKRNSAFSPQATFFNAGSAPQSNIPVRFQILNSTGTIVYNVASTITGPLAVEAEATVTFSSYTPGTAGAYTARAISQNADAVPSNDTLSIPFYVPNNLSGTYTVGAGGNLPTLKAAVDTLSRNDVAGPITFSLISANYTEPPLLIENVSYASSPAMVTFKPASGVSPRVFVTGTTPGSYGLAIVNSDNITIDGSNSLFHPNALDLTLEVDSASTVARDIISMTNARNITIQNVKMKGYYNPNQLSDVGTGVSIGVADGLYNSNITFSNIQLSRCFYGILHSGALGTVRDSNITVRNSTIGTVLGSVLFNTGMAIQNVYGAQIYGNTINGISYGTPYAGSGNAYGIFLGSAVQSKVYNNKVNSIANSGGGANAYRVTGIAVLGDAPGSASGNIVYNNMVWDVRTASTSTDASIQGIWVTSGANDVVAYNSVYLNGSSATNITSAGFQLETSSAQVVNNVFFNNRVDGTTGRSIAIFKNSTDGSSVLTSNYNVFFAPQTTGKVGAVTTTSYTSLFGTGSWNAATGQDGNSRLGNPRFVSDNDLHISTTIRTPVESGGTPLAAVTTTDIDGDVRNATTPDIGADEGTFLPQLPNDIQTLTIDDPVAGVTKKANVAFSPKATFTNTGSANQSSVPVRFRIYDAGNLTTPLFDLTASIASLPSGAVNQVTFTPAVTISTPGNYVAKAIAELGSDGDRTSDTVTLAFKVKNPLAGTYNIPSAEFATINDAVGDLRAIGVASAVTFLLGNQTFTQTAPIVIDTIAGTSAINTVTFKPAPGATPTITGDIPQNALITFNGCDYVIFDGSNTVGGTTRDLTVSNTTSNTSGTGGPVFWIHPYPLVPTGSDGAKKNVIKNCNIKGGVDQSTGVNTIYGILMSGTPLALPPTGGVPCDSNSFINNYITKVRIGIWLQGAGVASSKGTVISDNVIGPTSFGPDQIGRAGIILNTRFDGNLITRNTIRYVGGDFANTPANPASGVVDRVGIGLGSDAWPPTASTVINSVVTRNLIHHVIDERGNAAVAIAVAGSGTTNQVVANNMIYQVRSNGATSSKQTIGIGVSAGNGDKIVYNSILLTGDLDPAGTADAGQSAVGIRVTATTPANLTIKNNIISMDLTSNTSTLKHYCIVAATTTYNWGTGGSNYNVFDPKATNSQMVLGGIGTAVPYSDRTTLSAWQTTFAANQDLNSAVGDPQFVSGSDLHVASGSSPASNTGTPIAGVTDDFDGDTRSATTPDIGADEFAGTSTVNVNTSIASGWNMISNPVTNAVPDDSAKHLFPTIISRVFRFSGGYLVGDVMNNGVGYWGKFPAATTNTITGTARTRDSISVNAGWNMVGSITNTVDTNTITSVPAGIRASNWFGFAGGYSPVSQIIPGKAYWVKANAAGKFVFANPPVTGPAKSVVSSGPSLEILNTLTITDSKGGSQTLYFGADAGNVINVAMYAMPPAPPAGAMDARFESAEGGSLVRTHAATVEGTVAFPVTIQSDAYPVTVSWNVRGAASYELTDGRGGSIFRAKEMSGEGNITLTSPDISRITVNLVGDGNLPKEFALSQNYPNPFNPTTSIKYALPVDSRVTMELYNVIGQRVRTLVNDNVVAGYHVAEWDGMGNSGQQLASGVYFLRMSAKGVDGRSFSELRKMMMMK